jgi:hypothetical protein
MIKKAIPFFFSNGLSERISSKILNSVLVTRHEKTMNSAVDKTIPAAAAPGVPIEIKCPVMIAATPDVPPDINAVFALEPMKITAVIPQQIKNIP